MRPVRLLSVVWLFALWTLAGCVHLSGFSSPPPVPDGFARYTHSEQIKAVSPEGVVFRVRTEDNRPHAELPFWKTALKKRMLEAGYVLLSESPVSVENQPGYLLELTAPHGPQDYGYLMAIFVRDKKIVIIEAAGEVSHLTQRRPAIMAAIHKVKLD